VSGAPAGRVAVVTGAGRGLGREHALLFARGRLRGGQGRDRGPHAIAAAELGRYCGRVNAVATVADAMDGRFPAPR